MKRLLTTTMFLAAVLLNTVAQTVTLDKSSLQLNTGETYTLKVYYNGSEDAASWYNISSSNTAVATVTTDGLVTAIAPGTCTITFKEKYNSVSATCAVTVINPTPVTSVSLNKLELELRESETEQLTASILPEDAGNKALTWTTTDPFTAKVSSSGLVTAVSAGTAVITATAHNGINASCNVTVKPEEAETCKYIYKNDGELVVIPTDYIVSYTHVNKVHTWNLPGDNQFKLADSEVSSIQDEYIGDLPTFESFKFNNKFNDQLFDDAEGTIDNTNNKVNVTAAVIGKRLIPSFKLPEGASAYVDGVQQISKQTSRRFETPVKYTVAYPNNYIYQSRKIQDEVWSTPGTVNEDDKWILTKLELTADNFSTDYPSFKAEEGVASLVDNNINTCFHTGWGSAQPTWRANGYWGDGYTVWPYLQIEPAESLEAFKFGYTTRNTDDKYAPLGFILQVSNDGTNWVDIKHYTKATDDIPDKLGTSYLSNVIQLKQPYSKFRIQLTESGNKNYLVFSEFCMYKATPNPNYQEESEEPVLLQPAVYEQKFVPYGRKYKVIVDYPTDHPTTQYSVPRIDLAINFGDSNTSSAWDASHWIGMNGKDSWHQATFTMDGAGVWEDIPATSIKVKGRGNSSWANSYLSKNPYRMKFPEKVKMCGLSGGKNWVLLANKQDGSMTTNSIAMKIADQVGSLACNHIIPVELYVNGNYRGSYNLTEKVGISNNSIDVTIDKTDPQYEGWTEDQLAEEKLVKEANVCLLELDTYYDETHKFKTDQYNISTNIKYPDFEETDDRRTLTESQIKNSFNKVATLLINGPTYNAGKMEQYTDYVDMDAWARAWFVNDLTRNQECKHPKSWFVYNEDIQNGGLWQFGPVWDFDWSYGYDGTRQYFVYYAEDDIFNGCVTSNLGYPFFDALRTSTLAKQAYYKVWRHYVDHDGLTDLLEHIDDYYNYAQPSLQHNASQWNGEGNNYATQTSNAKNWLTKRYNYIWNNLTKYSDIYEDDIVKPEDPGQPTDVQSLMNDPEGPNRLVDVYTINGIRMRRQVPLLQSTTGLAPGLYIIEGRKISVR